MSSLVGLDWPDWVIRKIGDPILLESDWPLMNYPNSKYGGLLDGASFLSRDDQEFVAGGNSSIKVVTDAVSGHNSEIKTTIQAICKPGDLLAFEQKWSQNFPSAGTAFDTGIESRDNANIRQGRFRFTVGSLEWKYEDNNLVFQSFPQSIGGPLLIDKPLLSSSLGNLIGWSRVVIDPINRLYVGFEASGKNNKIETRDMRSMNLPLSSNGVAANPLYLFFILINAGSNTVNVGYTTDWCITKIPKGVDPFTP